QNLAAELLKASAGLNFQIIPYRGTPDVIVAVMRNDVQLMVDFYAPMKATLQDKKIRAVATTGKERSPFFTDVPTVAEAGVPGYEVVSWNGVFARYVVNRRSQDVVTGSAESWANAGQGREIRPFQNAHFCDRRHIQAARAIAIFAPWREGSHRWRLLWPILSVSDLSSARTPRCCWPFSGAGLRFASSARCPMTSPVVPAAGHPAERGENTTPPAGHH